jgi:parvulin-like peptidyl-prolyl isomerase
MGVETQTGGRGFSLDGHAVRPLRRAIVVALIALAACAVVPVRAQVIDRVIAVVSGTVIMQSDARSALALGLTDPGAARDPIEAAMRWLIDRQLVLDEAGRGERIEVDAAALAQALDGVRQRFASDEEFRLALAGFGLDTQALQRLVRDTLKARLYIERRFDAMLPATDEELRAYYASHAAHFVKNGRQVPFDEALAEVTGMLQQERRDQAIAAWMDRLRRRADIREVYHPAR